MTNNGISIGELLNRGKHPRLPFIRKPLHDLRHFDGSPGGLRTAIMVRAKATHFCLLFVFEQQDFVDDRLLVLHLNLRQRVTHRLSNVMRMRRFSSQNDAQANER